MATPHGTPLTALATMVAALTLGTTLTQQAWAGDDGPAAETTDVSAAVAETEATPAAEATPTPEASAADTAAVEAPSTADPAGSEPAPAESSGTIQLSPPAEGESVSKIQLTPQGTMPSADRSYHHHDGFYLRANFGFGPMWGDFTQAGASGQSSVSGSGLGFDLLIGGTPSPGFVVGGGIVGNSLFGGKFERDADAEATDSAGMALLGVFVDGFPRPTGGWHIGGLVGLGTTRMSAGSQDDDAGGLGGAVWAGYDQWVGSDMSVGGLLRFSALIAKGDEDSEPARASVGALTLMLTALYH